MIRNKQEGKSAQEFWSSQLGFILASSGSAIGLGQIWKFPYMAGVNGGSAFLLCYLVFVFLLAVPVFMAETLLGKMGKENPIKCLQNIKNQIKLPLWSSYVPYLGMLTLFLIICFYNVMASWSLPFMLHPTQYGKFFEDFLTNNPKLIFYFLIYTIACYSLVSCGVRKGIERSCTYLMPILLVILFILIFFSSKMSGFKQGIEFLFYPNFSLITTDIIIQAAGHALFSLATGACSALTYGTKLPDNIKIGKATFIVAFINIFVAFSAGLAIFPGVFTYGYEPSQGPILMYQIMPQIFGLIPSGGLFLGFSFFFLLFIAAITSSISLMEPWIVFIQEKLRINRFQSSMILFLLTLAPSIYFILSFNIFKEHHIFSFVADRLTSILLLLGALGYSLIVGFFLPKNKFFEEYNSKVYCLFYYSLKYIIPPIILLLLIKQWGI